MIWNDAALHVAAWAGMVVPFDPELINPASIDLRLGAAYRLPHPGWRVRMGGRPVTVNTQWGEERQMSSVGIELPPGQFVLCCSLETVSIPPDAVAFLYSKSSTGRMGLEHLHSGVGDPGFKGQWTWELINVAPWPIRITPGQRLMQMVVESMTAPATRDYSQTGRYQGQTGATPARGER